MDCHVNSQAQTMSVVQYSGGVRPPIVDANDGLVLLLVELTEVLVIRVLGVPTITQRGQEADQDSRES